MKIGTRTLITFEAAADWRAEREAAGAVRANVTKSARSKPGLPKPLRSTPPANARAKATLVKSARCEKPAPPEGVG
jgi:hypothetical protein